tara:strand:- start:3339 stop:4208 length:870 start_codon:yes stop_codon:yes gene_type:complete
MKISAVIVSRNDNYGGQLNERATYCLNSAIETYDEVTYVDWNSPTHSLLYDIKDNIKFKGNLKHIVIPPSAASHLTSHDEHAQKCCEVLARNIGLRRSTGDWLLSTNIDIIHPKRKELEETLNSLDQNTFYTISRRHADWDMIKNFHNGEIPFDQWVSLRDHLIDISEERHFPEKTGDDDDYSIINCCGDYQIAPKQVWHSIRGFEEELIYPLYADTNVQKKAAMHNFGLKAIFNPPLFHIDHGKGGGGFLTGVNKKQNDYYRAIPYQTKTENPETWGFSDVDIEYETF